MKLLSLNLRGVGGAPNLPPSEDYCPVFCPDILFLQETMVEEVKARALVSKLLPSWYCCAIDSVGLSGGLCVAWNPARVVLSPFVTCAGILLEGTLLEGNQTVSFSNCYGPCTDRKSLWDIVVNSGLLATKNLILAGDLNFTVSASEVWGSKARLDPMAEYFKGIFQDYGLVDIVPIDYVPTWHNKEEGQRA
jgi:hypothetical protein